MTHTESKIKKKNQNSIWTEENMSHVTVIDAKSPTKSLIKKVCYQKQTGENMRAFYLIDLSHLVKKYKKWRELMPRIRPYYAVKCNPDKQILSVLKKLGCGFDCASLNELKLVCELSGPLIPEQDIVFANPCKQVVDIKYARKMKIPCCTVDSTNELKKLKKHYPEAKILLRLVVDDSKSICRFSSKFGVAMEDAEELMILAKKLQLNLCGVSFHVGSGCTDPLAFVSAVKDAKKMFTLAKEKYDFSMSILDVGGGFPGIDNDEYSNISFETICKAMYPWINQEFPEGKGIRIIAEPGRYFAAGTSTLVCNVYSTRPVKSSPRSVDYCYFVNDGVYQSFNCKIFDHYKPKINSLKKNEFMDDLGNFIEDDKNKKVVKTYRAKLFGPTCDSMDTINDCVLLPLLEEEDWIYVENFGAYTIAAASGFNGYGPPEFYYYWRK